MKKRDTASLYKWKFAIGTTSRVPHLSNRHYLIGDIDTEISFHNILMIQAYKPKNVILQATQHGWHFYTDAILTFKQLCTALAVIECDKKWIRIGQKRGYFFLADKGLVTPPWPVERMVLHAAKTKG